jgi:hypothetical protein
MANNINTMQIWCYINYHWNNTKIKSIQSKLFQCLFYTNKALNLGHLVKVLWKHLNSTNTRGSPLCDDKIFCSWKKLVFFYAWFCMSSFLISFVVSFPLPSFFFTFLFNFPSFLLPFCSFYLLLFIFLSSFIFSIIFSLLHCLCICCSYVLTLCFIVILLLSPTS